MRTWTTFAVAGSWTWYSIDVNEALENLDYSGLHLLSTTVTIEITPNQGEGRKLTATLSAANAVTLIGGTKPCNETYEQIYRSICEQKGSPAAD